MNLTRWFSQHLAGAKVVLVAQATGICTSNSMVKSAVDACMRFSMSAWVGSVESKIF